MTRTVILRAASPIQYPGPSVLRTDAGLLITDKTYSSVVGTEPVWGDDSTDTYVEFLVPPLDQRYRFACAPLQVPDAPLTNARLVGVETVITVGATTAVTAAGMTPFMFDSSFSPITFTSSHAWASDTGIAGTGLLPAVEMITSWFGTDSTDATYARFLDIVNSGSAYFGVAARGPGFGSSTNTVRVYEAFARLTYEVNTQSTMRKYPNPTGLGVGPARHWPRPRRGISGIR